LQAADAKDKDIDLMHPFPSRFSLFPRNFISIFLIRKISLLHFCILCKRIIIVQFRTLKRFIKANEKPKVKREIEKSDFMRYYMYHMLLQFISPGII